MQNGRRRFSGGQRCHVPIEVGDGAERGHHLAAVQIHAQPAIDEAALAVFGFLGSGVRYNMLLDLQIGEPLNGFTGFQ